MEKVTDCFICGSVEFLPHLDCKDYFLSGEDFPIVKCKNCGFVFTNPRPKPADLGKYYESDEYISHSNSKKGLLNIR